MHKLKSTDFKINIFFKKMKQICWKEWHSVTILKILMSHTISALNHIWYIILNEVHKNQARDIAINIHI